MEYRILKEAKEETATTIRQHLRAMRKDALLDSTEYQRLKTALKTPTLTVQALNKMIEDQEYEMQVCRAKVGVAKASYKPLADFIKKMGEAQSKAIHVISQVFELGGE
jgi:hypothetical protein